MIQGLLARIRSLWRGLAHRDEVDAAMAEEFRHHLDLRAAELVRSGLAPDAAARQARLEFGHVDTTRRDARASRGLAVLDAISATTLDVRLGVRMLRKYPGLSVIAVVGMTVAIAIGVGALGFIEAVSDPSLPLDEGDRVVAIQVNDRATGSPNRQVLHEYVEWRAGLRTVDDLAAFMIDRRTIGTHDDDVDLVPVAMITASGFRVARTLPALGRTLLDEDERPGALPVVVIAFEEWQRRFEADPGILGQPIQLGGDVYTIVGVMPHGFRFPVSDRFWIPLKLDPGAYARGGGPALNVFGRLADGVSMAEAQAELTVWGQRLAGTDRDAYEHRVPRVLPYTWPLVGIDSGALAWVLRALYVALALLFVVVAVNVGVLVYARTAVRGGEIALRTALGASRRRIVLQLSVEALVMSGVAALLGIAVAWFALGQVQAFQERFASGQLPFWVRLRLSPSVIAYSAGLALLGAIIVGVLPALQATGRRMHEGLQQLSARGTGLQLGRAWTGLIVAQVAIAVAVMPFAVHVAAACIRRGTQDVSYPSGEILRATLSMERDEAPADSVAAAYTDAFTGAFRERTDQLLHLLRAQPAIAAATFARRFPEVDAYETVEVEGGGLRWVRTNDVAYDLLDAASIPLIAGRAFRSGDARPGANVVIVDRTFTDQLLSGGSAVGRRIRFVPRTTRGQDAEPGPWLDVVGVVPAIAIQNDFDGLVPLVMRPASLETAPTILSLVVRLRDGHAPEVARRMRQLAASVDPRLQLRDVRTAHASLSAARQGLLAIALVIGAVTGSVLLLSAAGIYAMMSFTVTRRRREIAIRSALGANPRRLLTGIFATAGAQIATGCAVGLILAAAIRGPVSGKGMLLLPLVALLMLVVGLVAALGPARRGLSVQPSEAMREE